MRRSFEVLFVQILMTGHANVRANICRRILAGRCDNSLPLLVGPKRWRDQPNKQDYGHNWPSQLLVPFTDLHGELLVYVSGPVLLWYHVAAARCDCNRCDCH